VEPYNYILPNTGNPFASALQGFQAGTAIRDRQEAERAQAEAQRAAQELAAAQASARANLMDKIRSGAQPSMADIMEYSTLLPPEQVKALNDQFNQLPKEAQQNELGFGVRMISALKSDPQVASDLLMGRAESYRNAGEGEKAQVMEAIAKQALINPVAAVSSFAPIIASLPGGKDALSSMFGPEESAAEIGKTRAETAKTYQEARMVVPKAQAEIANINSQIQDRANRFMLDSDRLTSETQARLDEASAKAGELPPEATKLLNESVIASTASESSAAQLHELAVRVRGLGSSWGMSGSGVEWLAEAFGEEDAASQIRKDVIRLTNAEALKLLPPGPATDTDVRFAREAFLKPNADPETLANGLQAMARLSAFDAARQRAKSEWVASAKNLGRARSDMEVDGVRVAKGTSFIDFERAYTRKKGPEIYKAAQGLANENQLNTRSYMQKYGGGATGGY
jgi:hypothetical protein